MIPRILPEWALNRLTDMLDKKLFEGKRPVNSTCLGAAKRVRVGGVAP